MAEEEDVRSGDDGVHGEVVGLGGEVGKELEGPAEADEVGGLGEMGEETVVVAAATTETTASPMIIRPNSSRPGRVIS